jgi:hypothetical protein
MPARKRRISSHSAAASVAAVSCAANAGGALRSAASPVQ